MPTSDEQHKEYILGAITILNDRLRDAAAAGLTVEIQDVAVQTLGQRAQGRVLSATITRITSV